MNKDQRESFLARIRETLVAANAVADYTKPTFAAQIDEIDKVALRGHIDRLAVRTLIFAHALEVMDAGLFPHPMQAFMHAVECEGPIADSEFFSTLEGWAKLCGYRSNENVIIMGDNSSAKQLDPYSYDGGGHGLNRK